MFQKQVFDKRFKNFPFFKSLAKKMTFFVCQHQRKHWFAKTNFGKSSVYWWNCHEKVKTCQSSLFFFITINSDLFIFVILWQNFEHPKQTNNFFLGRLPNLPRFQKKNWKTFFDNFFEISKMHFYLKIWQRWWIKNWNW